MVIGEKYSIRYPVGVADDKLKERHSGILKAKIQQTPTTWELDFEPKGFRRTPESVARRPLYIFPWPTYEIRPLGKAPKPNKNTTKRMKRTDTLMDILLSRSERVTPEDVADTLPGVDINAVHKFPVSAISNIPFREQYNLEAIDWSLLDAAIHHEFKNGITDSMEVINMLLSAGADPSLGLVSAVALDQVPILNLLLESGANINTERKAYRGRYKEVRKNGWNRTIFEGEHVVLQRPLDLAIPTIYSEPYGYRSRKVYPTAAPAMMLHLLDLDAEVSPQMIDRVTQDIAAAKTHLQTYETIERKTPEYIKSMAIIQQFIDQQTTQILPALEAAYAEQQTRPEGVEYHAARERFYGRPFPAEERENRDIAANLAMLTLPKNNTTTSPLPVSNFNKTLKAWNKERANSNAAHKAWETQWLADLRKPPVLAPPPSPPPMPSFANLFTGTSSRSGKSRKVKYAQRK